MTAQERRRAAGPAGLLLALEREEKIGHVGGIVADFARIRHAQLVGLALIVAAVFQKQQARALRQRLGDGGYPLREDGAQQQRPRGQRRASLLLFAVAGRYVAQLVAQHPGKLRLVVEMRHNAAREVHVAIGRGKGVYHRRIEDGKLVTKIGPAGNGGHLLAFLVDEFLQGRVVEQTKLGNYLRVGLLGRGRGPETGGASQRQQRQRQRANSQGRMSERFHLEES